MAAQPGKKRHGCLFYGGIIATTLLLCIVIGTLLGLRHLRRMINDFTEATPMVMPAVQMSAAEIEQVRDRVTAFQQAVSQGRATSPLELTADEVNALVATDPNYRALKGKAYVSITNGVLKSLVSAPLDQLGLSAFKGRYLNGEVVIRLSFQNGVLEVYAESVHVKGKPIPSIYMNRLRQQNLAAGINKDSRTSAALEKLEKIQVEDGKLIIVPQPH
jgi:hypothetical protein